MTREKKNPTKQEALQAATPGSVLYRCRISRSFDDAQSIGSGDHGAFTDEFERTNGRAATREVRRMTKHYGPLVFGEVVMSWVTARGHERTKTLHQCRTDATGRISARGEEV